MCDIILFFYLISLKYMSLLLFIENIPKSGYCLNFWYFLSYLSTIFWCKYYMMLAFTLCMGKTIIVHLELPVLFICGLQTYIYSSTEDTSSKKHSSPYWFSHKKCKVWYYTSPLAFFFFYHHVTFDIFRQLFLYALLLQFWWPSNLLLPWCQGIFLIILTLILSFFTS